MKVVKFDFPTDYEDTSVEGDKLWNKLMPSKQLLPLYKPGYVYPLTATSSRIWLCARPVSKKVRYACK
jgi:hypothetical protein